VNNSAQTNDASGFANASTDLHLIPAKPLGEDGCCVRQNRVVLASVADATPCGDVSAQPGAGTSSIREATVTKRIRRRGEHGISRQTIAQGMPACSGCTCMLVCATLYTIAHETAGAASTRHSLPPSSWREGIPANLGRSAPREREVTFSRHHPPCAQLRTGAGDPVFQGHQ